VNGEVISVLNPVGLHRWIGEQSSPVWRGLRGESKPLTDQATTILVVDDSISVRRVLTRHLRTIGAMVDEAADGQSALTRLRSRAYRLVVTDLEMPGLDGFELLAEMSRSPTLAAIPVIVASTKADQETRRRVLALGARIFLAKPVDPVALVGAARLLLAGAGIVPGGLRIAE
jgi:CheY-like chemotaxis protein